MPTISVKETVSKDLSSLWKMIVDVSSYPKYMTPISSVRILESNGTVEMVEWEALLKGSIVRWTGIETRFPEQHRIQFCQTEGDFERFAGYWQLKAVSAKTSEVEFFVDFEMGVPSLREMLNPVIERAITENSQSMIRSLDTNSLIF